MRAAVAGFATFILVLAIAVYSRIPTAAATGIAEFFDSATSTTETTLALSTAGERESSAAIPVGAQLSDVLAENAETHDDAEDAAWDSAAVVSIVLNGDSIAAEAESVTVDGSTATVTAAGSYSLSGSLTDGQIVVDSPGEGTVRLILNGVEIRNSTSAPLVIEKADEAVIVLAEGTENSLSDAATYVFADPTTDEPNAALFSAADLTISGTGALTVEGNYNDGIASKDGLVITGGTLTVQAADDGIRGKDYLVIRDGVLTVDAQGDGLKSDNAEETDKGYLAIEAGTITVTAGGDAIAAESDVLIADGVLALTSGGGSGSTVAADVSAKGIKATVSVVVDGGTFTIDAADDAVHSNGSVTINGGSFAIATGDDGMHADATLEINAGKIQIAESYEGLESAVITLNGGEIQVVADDDGINVAGGVDGSGMNPGRMRPGGGGQDAFSYTGSYYLYINGGTIVVDVGGDGLDVNGAAQMTGGVVLVDGPTNNGNAALDYDGGFAITGGLLLASGSAGMAQAPDSSSSQLSILVNFNATQSAGTLVHIADAAGTEIATFAPAKQFQSIVVSSPEFVSGESYTIYTGGSVSEDGSYTPGTQSATLSLSGIVTTSGSVSRGGGRRP